MRKKLFGNERGEIVIATTAVLIIVGVLGFLAGSSGLRKWVPGLANKENKTVERTVTRSESKPIIVKGVDGKEMFLYATKTETSTSELSEQQKLTLWEKLMVLPKMWLLLMVLGIFFPPVAAIMAAMHRRLWGETKKIVGGVEESLKKLEAEQPEAKKVVLDTLSKKMDRSTKDVVSKIKSQL